MHRMAHPPTARLGRALLLLACVLLALAPARAPIVRAAPLSLLVTKFDDTADGTCGSSDCSLREAIIAANNNPGLDTITVPAGDFTLSRTGAGEDLALTGDLDLREAVTFTMAGVAKIGTSVDFDDRLIHVLPGVSVTLSSLNLSGGRPASGSGGAILNQGTLTLNNSTVGASSAAGGGAIASSGTLTLSGSTISGNTASGAANGGGILSSGTLALSGSTISGNTAAGGSGGGVFASGIASIAASTIKTNTALAGGGLAGSATFELNESTVSGNTASANGGGGALNSGTLTVASSAVYGNTAGGNGHGGGILNTGALSLANSTISGNTAAAGGGVANANSAVFASATIAHNTATGGSGGGVLNASGKTATLKNTLLAENNGAAAPDCAGTLVSQGYNLVGTVAGACVVGSATGDLPNRDAQLGALKDNGGGTFTHALLAGSPALDAASPAAPGSGGNACPGADQRGVARPQMGRCDIGAYELPGISIVDFAFEPPNLVVQAGTTVRWKNLGAALHTTISDVSSFDNWVSPNIAPGGVFLHTFNTNGTFNYHCSIHPNTMSGKITVVGQSTAPSALLTSLSPNSAPAGSPDLTLVLSGLNFDPDAAVQWNATALQVTSHGSDQIIAKVPAALLASPGFANVRVVNSAQTGGASNALRFTVSATTAPVLDALSPASAQAGGPAFTLTLLGSGFAAGATVLWNSTTLTPDSVSAGQVKVQVPANLIGAAGSASVKVVNQPADGGASNARTFTITSPGDNPVPSITLLSPNSARPGSGPLVLTISGAGFAPGSTVQFGGVSLTPQPGNISAGRIVITLPAGLLVSVGTFDVSVTNPAPGGGVSNTLPFKVQQQYRAFLPLARK